MPCMLFDRVDDYVEWTTLAAPLAGANDGARTIVVVCKSDTGGVYQCPFGMLENASDMGTGLVKGVSNTYDFVTIFDWTSLFSGWPTSAPLGIVVTKANGFAFPTWTAKNLSTGASVVSYAEASSQASDGGSCAQIEVGRNLVGDFWGGHIGVVAVFDYVMTSTEADECLANQATSDLTGHSAGAPVFCAELNTLTPTDLMGNASSFSNTGGATLDSGEDLFWDFDGGGPADPPQIIRPDADIVTTGWTSTPIHSKVSDNADGTVVTGALT